MLSKCANPKCTATLRYLHQGRLFVTSRQPAISLETHIDYRWLCDGCCRSMTIADNGTIQRFRQSWFRHANQHQCA